MSTAVNLFLRQCILRGGLPFRVGNPRCNKALSEAMDETDRIADDPNAKGYDSMEELGKALMED